jgi:hypothetical protein
VSQICCGRHTRTLTYIHTYVVSTHLIEVLCSSTSRDFLNPLTWKVPVAKIRFTEILFSSICLHESNARRKRYLRVRGPGIGK